MEAGVKKKLVLNGCWCYKPRFQDPIRQIIFATLCKSEPRIQDPICQTYSCHTFLSHVFWIFFPIIILANLLCAHGRQVQVVSCFWPNLPELSRCYVLSWVAAGRPKGLFICSICLNYFHQPPSYFQRSLGGGAKTKTVNVHLPTVQALHNWFLRERQKSSELCTAGSSFEHCPQAIIWIIWHICNTHCNILATW